MFPVDPSRLSAAVDGWSTPALFVLALTAKYWLGPLLVRSRNRIYTGRPEFQPVTADRPLPPAVSAELARVEADLAALGFAATPALVDATGGHPGGVQLFEHPEHGDVAVVIAIPRPDGALHSLVGFTATLRGGARVCTGNSPLPSVFAPRRGTTTARFPGERETRSLYALHRAHVRSRGRDTVPTRLHDPVAYQQAEEDASRRSWIDTGYAYRDGETIRPTWKGAFCMTYRLLFPWRQWGEWRNERLRRRLAGDVPPTPPIATRRAA